MPDLPLPPAPMLDAIEGPPTLDAIDAPPMTPDVIEHAPAKPAGTSVLITEQEVVFATATAVPLPSERPGHRLAAMLRALVAGWTQPSPPRRRPDAPSRMYYLERARMGREMETL